MISIFGLIIFSILFCMFLAGVACVAFLIWLLKK